MKNLNVKQCMYRDNMALDPYLAVDYWVFWKLDVPIFIYWNRAFQGNLFEY